MRKKTFYVIAAMSVLAAALWPSGIEALGQPPLKILLSNDDGIDAPGLDALFDRLSAIARVTVAAPTQNYGGFGHAMTFREPILVSETEKKGAKWYAIKATPPSCVRLALDALLTQKPDFVIAGINPGENTGLDTYYSATVACAREAAFLGVPAISVHLTTRSSADFGPAADFVAELVQTLRKNPLKPGIYLNVNVPGLPRGQIKGVLIARQDLRPTLESFDKRINPRGQAYFWNVYKDLDQGTEKTDVWAVRNGYIAVTPLQFDQTGYPELKELEFLKIAGLENSIR
jgi:5'-nucleotidase